MTTTGRMTMTRKVLGTVRAAFTSGGGVLLKRKRFGTVEPDDVERCDSSSTKTAG